MYALLCIHDPTTIVIYTLSLHDALPIFGQGFEKCLFCADVESLRKPSISIYIVAILTGVSAIRVLAKVQEDLAQPKIEEHTSELQSRFDLVCRLLLEKKKTTGTQSTSPS